MMRGKEYNMVCMNYMFDNKICIEDELPCGYGDIPDDKSQCRNEKYKPLLLPEGYSDLIMKELRG